MMISFWLSKCVFKKKQILIKYQLSLFNGELIDKVSGYKDKEAYIFPLFGVFFADKG